MIHTFKALGCYIAMDVDSGAVHVLDELSYDLLNCVTPPMAEHCPEDVIEKLSQYPRAELEECWQELKELAKEKLLFEEEDYINPQWAVVKNTPIKALCLNAMTATCAVSTASPPPAAMAAAVPSCLRRLPSEPSTLLSRSPASATTLRWTSSAASPSWPWTR